MSKSRTIKVGPLKLNELEEAARIARLAFGTFLGLPNPLDSALSFSGRPICAPAINFRPIRANAAFLSRVTPFSRTSRAFGPPMLRTPRR